MPQQQHIMTVLERYGKGDDILSTLSALVTDFPGAVTFSTSFGWEDQVITHLIKSNNLDISIFTLDTGRLFPETYSTWSRTREAYGADVKAYYPNTEAVEGFVSQNGPNAFYEALEFRKTCCFIRKVEPLRRALAGNSIWITGLRAEQSATRENMNLFEWDEGNALIKYNPLLAWHLSDVQQYIAANKVPYNPLHDKGFVSIGCAPCTRAIKPGEDFRSGRWWWEDSTKKECGLHVQTLSK